ncbi:pirin family protein [Shewanella litorisediminis]|uniref:Pirin family protein n=1 Tax=Shewanella litorisediminis TaxID=1173586 RepID=A0ABX7G759_9GAMM|nr:pirin family protein [Shewanella litorisediminis]MCL2916715.1 pirin family protein [Shewanella litorisediminis]QRH03114.1 pirin family protein [Shewanella litorisediminis]
MITLRPANERGHASHGWLDSFHSFSFAEYYDPLHMGFSALRVINDDTVAPGAGFAPHGHRDMEILSYVLAGSIRHQDSEGNIATLPAGEFQLMSAGQGIRHSEYNGSRTEALRFLQIWIMPSTLGGEPGYQQKHFGSREGFTLIASPDGRDESFTVRQDARVYQLLLAPGLSIALPLSAARKGYLHLVEGALSIQAEHLGPGDGAKLEGLDSPQVTNLGTSVVRALMFDLP